MRTAGLYGSRRQVLARLGQRATQLPKLPVRRARSGLAERWMAAALRRRRQERDMVAVLDAVGRAARSGAGLRGALEAAQPAAGVHSDELGFLLSSLNHGVGLAEALGGWRERCPGEAVALASTALALGGSSGASLARSVDGAAATMRERVALRSEVRVHAAQARSSAAVVGIAPLAFTAFSAMADPAVASFLVTTSAGWLCLGVGLALTAAGIVWMQYLVGRAEGA